MINSNLSIQNFICEIYINMLNNNNLHSKILKFIGIFVLLIVVELFVLQFLAYIEFIKPENSSSLFHITWHKILDAYKLSYINLPILLAVTAIFFKLFVVDNNHQYKRVFLFLLLWSFGFQNVFTLPPLLILLFIFKLPVNSLFLLISSPGDFPLGYLLFIYVFVLLGTVVAYYVFRKYLDKKSIQNFGYKSSTKVKDSLYGFIIGTLFITICVVILLIFDTISFHSFRLNIANQLLYVVFFLVAAINEEVIFRGYVLETLLEKGNKFVALFSSAVIFAVFHALNPNINLFSFINLILAGMFLGIFYIYKRNLYLPTFLHFAWNYFQGPIYGFGVSGLKFEGILHYDVVVDAQILTGGDFGLEGSILTTIFMIIITIAVIVFFEGRKKLDYKKSIEYAETEHR